MESANPIIFVGVLIFLAHLFAALFERTRVPDVLYLILIGLFIGPVFHLVSPTDFGVVGHIFTSITLVIILFEGGLELSFKSLQQSIKGILGVTFVSYFLCFGFLAITLLSLTSFEVRTVLFLSAVLAGPAPSVIIPIVRQMKPRDSTKTILMLESPIGEALCIVVSLGILESFQLTEINIGKLTGGLLSSFLLAVIIGAIGGYTWSVLLHRVRKLRNAILTTPAFVFIIYGITEFLHFSGPVAALTFGMALGNAGVLKIPWITKRLDIVPLQHNETEKLFFGEIVFILKTFFFVYLGLSIRFTDFWSMELGFVLTLVLLLSRILSVRLVVDRAETSIEDASFMASLIPKGTAAAVLASALVNIGVPGGELVQNIIYGVIIISIVTTASLIFMLERGGIKRLYAIVFNRYAPSSEFVDEERK